jgi:MFS family permease
MGPRSVIASKADLKPPPYAWVILFVIYIASLAAPLNQFKVPPVMPVLKEVFNLDYGSAGMLMSIFSIMGFVLAIPAGFILQRFGIKLTSLAAVGAVMIGSCLGALSNTSELLFFGRFIEGSGMGLIMVAAPSAIALWFPAARRGLPMGLWASCVGVGSIATLNLAPVLVASSGWRSVWWAGTVFAAAAFIFFGIFFRLPRKEEMRAVGEQNDARIVSDTPLSLGKAMANRSLWLISIEFGCFNLVVMAWSTFYPDFLNTVRNYSLASASFMTSLMILMGVCSGPIGGYLSDRLKSRKLLIVVPFVLLAVLLIFPFNVTGLMIPAIILTGGFLAGPVAPVSLAAVPEIMKSPRLAGIGLGVAALGQNVGMFIGPAMFGKLLETTSWVMAGYLMIPVCIIALIAASMAKIR